MNRSRSFLGLPHRHDRVVLRALPLLIRLRWPLLVASCLICVSLGQFFVGTPPDNHYRSFVEPGDLYRQRLDTVEQTFAARDNVFIALRPGRGDLFEPGALRALAELTELAWRLPYARRVESLANFPLISAQGDLIGVEDLLGAPASWTAASLAGRRQQALAEPALLGRLLAADAGTAGVNVSVVMPDADFGPGVPRLDRAVRELLAGLERKYPDVAFHYGGVLSISAAFFEVSYQSFALLIPLAFAALTLVLWLALRNLRATVAILGVAALSTMAAMGLAVQLGYPITPTLTAAPLIILSLAVADGVHLLAPALRRMAQGSAWIPALRASLRVNARPVVLTSLTTMLGLLGLNFSTAPPLRHLGNTAALGVLLALGLTLVLLPLAVPRRMARPAPRQPAGLWVWLAGLPPRTVLFVCGGLVLLAMSGLPRNELRDNPVEYFDESTRLRQDAEFIDRHLGSLNFVDFVVDSGRDQGIVDPVLMATVEALQNWLLAQPEVTGAYSVVDVLKRINQTLHPASARYRLPGSAGEIAQYLLLYELSLDYGQDLNDQLDLAKSRLRLTVGLRNLSSVELVAFERRALDWMAGQAAAVDIAASGPALMFAHMSLSNTRSLLFGTFVSLACISLVLLLYFGSPRIGFISLIPNLLPSLMALGIWGYALGSVSFSLSIVAVMTFGIVVDDTNHCLHRYQHRRRRGDAAEAAVATTLRDIGPALLTTSATILAGLLVMGLSDFEVNAQLGQLGALTVALALALDLLLLPALLKIFDRRPYRLLTPTGSPRRDQPDPARS